MKSVRPAPVPFLLLVVASPLLAFPSPEGAAEARDEGISQVMVADPLWPAARRHVRQIDGRFYKLTSRLTRIVELNFTFGNGNQSGKAVIAEGLDRIAATYGGITVRHFKQGTDGATGPQPDFTVEDLLTGQVIVANNVGRLNSAELGVAKQEAIRKAIETEGRGYLGFRASGEIDGGEWPWLSGTFFPLEFQGHGARVNAPLYKHLAEAGHIVMEGILEAHTTNAIVPDEVDASGKERLSTVPVPIRQLRNEWYKFGRHIADDAAFKDKFTILLKYDPRDLGTTMEAQYRRKGGNVFTYLHKVGAGMTSFIPAGREYEELLGSRGLDGDAGDFDRYVAQTLFFLAGYDTTDCDASCDSLPIVDEGNRLVGRATSLLPEKRVPIAGSGVVFGSRQPTFHSSFGGRYEARLLDTRGRVVESRMGEGAVTHAFGTRGLPAGVYLLCVKAGSGPIRVKRYAL